MVSVLPRQFTESPHRLRVLRIPDEEHSLSRQRADAPILCHWVAQYSRVQSTRKSGQLDAPRGPTCPQLHILPSECSGRLPAIPGTK